MTFRSKVFYKNIKGTLYQLYLVIYLFIIYLQHLDIPIHVGLYQYMITKALAYELVAGPEFNLKQTTLA